MAMYNVDELFRLACQLQKKWGLLLGFHDDSWVEHQNGFAEIQKACPFLDVDTDYQAVCDRNGFLFFDTREDMETHYNQVVGDDGPTELNPYQGPVTVYALTCNPDGVFLNENT